MCKGMVMIVVYLIVLIGLICIDDGKKVDISVRLMYHCCLVSHVQKCGYVG
jgi:hypothetical protein